MKFLNSPSERMPGMHLYLFHNYIPKIVHGHTIEDTPYFETKDGERLVLGFEVGLIEEHYRRIIDDDTTEYYAATEQYEMETGKEYGDWTESPFYYKKGMVVTMSDEERSNYLYDGWCNIYLRHHNEKAKPANDCGSIVDMLFVC